MKKLLIIGIAISMVIMLNACSQQTQAETTSTTTAMETTEITTETETTEVMTSSESGFNKEVYELLKLNWMNFLYTDENELRCEAESMLQMEPGEENLEAIIQELLAIDRGSNPFQESQSASQSETQSAGESLAETTPSPEPTKAVSENKPAETQQTAPAPQQTEPAPTQTPTQAPTQPQQTPQPSDTGAAISKEEEDAIWDQAAADLGLGEEVDASTKLDKTDGKLDVGPGNGGYDWH